MAQDGAYSLHSVDASSRIEKYEHDIDVIMRAYGTDVLSINSISGTKAAWQKRRGLTRLILNELFQQVVKIRRARSREYVKDHYDSAYSGNISIGFPPLEKFNNFFGKNIVYRSQTPEHRLASIHTISSILSELDIRTVCEGGCGVGGNLFYLSSVLPHLEYSGFDVSQNAIDYANSLLKSETIFDLGIIPELAELLGSKNQSSRQSPRFFQSSIDHIELPDKSVDVLFTHAALEQCNAILPGALADIRRVTKRYAIFYEPIWDANSLLERVYLRSRNYFCSSVSEIEEHGFKALRHLDIFPEKPTFSFSLLLCEIT